MGILSDAKVGGIFRDAGNGVWCVSEKADDFVDAKRIGPDNFGLHRTFGIDGKPDSGTVHRHPIVARMRLVDADALDAGLVQAAAQPAQADELTLRDRFAMAALVAAWAEFSPRQFAKEAYEIADAMLAARGAK